jgi:hypothetical protein
MDNFYEELGKIMEKGDEQAARDFIVNNLDKFPQDAQDAIVTALFEETLVAKTESEVAVADFQKQALAVSKAIEGAREALERQGKLADIKSDL